MGDRKAPGGRVYLSLAMVALFFMFASIAPLLVPAKFARDSNAMLRAAEGVLHVDASFRVMARLIDIFGYNVLTTIVIVGSAFVVLKLVAVPKTIETFAYALISIAAAAPMWMVRPQKEVLVVILTTLCLFLIKHIKYASVSIACVVSLYCAYAHEAGRQYYYIIAFVFVFIYTISGWRVRSIFISLLLPFLAVFIMPRRLLIELNQVRNVLNYFTVLDGTVKTAFLNPEHSNTPLAFLLNYGYASVRLNFPIIFHPGLKECFLTLFIMAWLRLLWGGFRSASTVPRMAACLILAHMTVSWIFEPDLGSYLRHMSSVVILILPLIEALDNQKLCQDRSLSFGRGGSIMPPPTLSLAFRS